MPAQGLHRRDRVGPRMVSKAAPGQVLLYAANRSAGSRCRSARCAWSVIGPCWHTGRPVPTGPSPPTSLRRRPRTSWPSRAAAARSRPRIRAAGTCARAARSRRLHLHRQADLPAWAHHARQGGAPLAGPRSARALRSPAGGGADHRSTDKVVFRARRAGGRVPAPCRPRGPSPRGRRSATTRSRSCRRTTRRAAPSKCRSTRKPEFEVRMSPANRFVLQGNAVRATIDARYYFGQPVARGRVHYVVHQQPYYSPCAGATTRAARVAGGMPATRRSRATCACPTGGSPISRFRRLSTTTRATTACESRRASPTPAAAKCRATRSFT